MKRKDKSRFLSEKQDRFCQLYAGYDVELQDKCWANGTQSFSMAYRGEFATTKKDMAYCNWKAWHMLKKEKICKRIQKYADSSMNDSVADTKLAFLIKQYSDFGVAIRAISEYNRLKKRVTQKIEYTKLEPEELDDTTQKISEEIDNIIKEKI